MYNSINWLSTFPAKYFYAIVTVDEVQIKPGEQQKNDLATI